MRQLRLVGIIIVGIAAAFIISSVIPPLRTALVNVGIANYITLSGGILGLLGGFMVYQFGIPGIKFCGLLRARRQLHSADVGRNEIRYQYFLRVNHKRAKPIQGCRAVPKIPKTKWNGEIVRGASACWLSGNRDPERMEERANIDGERRLLLYELSDDNKKIYFWAFDEVSKRSEVRIVDNFLDFANLNLRLVFESTGDFAGDEWSRRIAEIQRSADDERGSHISA